MLVCWNSTPISKTSSVSSRRSHLTRPSTRSVSPVRTSSIWRRSKGPDVEGFRRVDPGAAEGDVVA